MNIEDIKTELAKLEPEAEAAWDEYKRLEAISQPAQVKWHALYRRCEQLKSALELLEPSKIERTPEDVARFHADMQRIEQSRKPKGEPECTTTTH